MSERRFDAIVLGGGPAGYVCAIRLGQLGLRTACVEAEEVGGICLNWGCIPSKALITNAHIIEQSARIAEQGLLGERLAVDAGRMQSWKDGIVRKLTGGIRGLFRANQVTLIEGTGRLTGARTLEVTGVDGAVEVLTAERAVVIATGSSTIEVPGFEFDGERVISAREAVSLKSIPRRMLVVGGGVIGLELGMAYQSFGSELTVVELTSSLLPGLEPDCVKVVERELKKRGARVLCETRAEGCERDAAQGVVVQVSTAGVQERLVADKVLVAVGMRPRSRGLGLEQLGVELDDRGFIRTDATCRTNIDGLFAIGDVSGAPMLAHKASKEGEVCAEAIAGRASAKDWVAIPGVVFTQPEIASVGLTEQAATAQGLTVRSGKFGFAALGRAVTLGETDGFVKVVTEVSTGEILGIHIVGPSASDLISEAVLALEMGARAADLALTIHPHPTLGEALMEASAASLGHAIHMVNR